MMKQTRHFTLHYSSLTAITFTFVFIVSGCPNGWTLFESSCYHFVSETPMIQEEADAICWVSDGLFTYYVIFYYKDTTRNGQTVDLLAKLYIHETVYSVV